METRIDKRNCPCKTIPWTLSAFTAAEFGDVHALVRKGNNIIHKHDSAGYTPLHIAAQHNHVAATSLLLQMGANVNGGGETTENTNYDSAHNNRNGATPLHRAAFAGATATMSLLLQEPTCDLLARDTSFGDLKTPLHKAAAGGRYLAIQLLLQELQKRNLLHVALAATDSTHQTPIQTAQDCGSRQDEERESVARWDEVAGGPADWQKCVTLLRAAAADVDHGKGSSKLTTGAGLKRDLPFPPVHLSTIDGCLDCKQSDGNMCLTASWQEAFQAALGSAVNQVETLTLPVGERQEFHSTAGREDTTPSTGVARTSDNERWINSHSQNKQQSEIGVLASCSSCGQRVISFYKSQHGLLVCKSCHRSKR